MTFNSRRFSALVVALTFAGCAPVEPNDEPLGFDEAPVSDLESLVAGVPADADLPDESKADETYPATFDLLDIQSPVQSQGSRGVCSIFATVGLMESLYIAEGTLPNPDFSEQFLQWSVKTEVGAFQMTDGSSAQRNLEAISRFGVVEETAWPYQPRGWGTSDDPLCTGDGRPVRCYTNGEPPAMAREAMRFQLPRGRWISSRRRSIQGHMVTKRTPVQIGGDFFYQSWQHGGSMLTTVSSLSRRGIVLAPNAEDIADSRMRPAGHSILIVGWDDNMEVQRIDAMGQPLVDAMGNPVMERGFFLFKNSWGTGRFGIENPMGAGYGWISMAYVEEYMTSYVSALPTVRLPPETCNNGTDDDRDGATDCEDSDCASDRACMDSPTGTTHMATPMLAIPDNNTTGISSDIMVADAGPISSLAVRVDLAHSYRGDLRITLSHGGTTVTLLDRAGGADDDVRETFSVADFNGADAAGPWTLTVVDTANADTGTLESWGLDITRCMGGDCTGAATARRYEGMGANIPDANPMGVTSDIEITDSGEISALSVSVAMTHTFPYELVIRLQKVGGREFVLLRESTIEGPSIERTFTVDGFVGESLTGTWRLTVVDNGAGDVGTLDSWSIDATTR